MGPDEAPGQNGAAVRMFGRRLRAEGAEHVFLFGSRTTGRAALDSDYDLMIVSTAFQDVPRLARHRGLHEIFYEAGGFAPLDLICLTAEELEQARKRPTLVQAVLPDAIDLLAEAPSPA